MGHYYSPNDVETQTYLSKMSEEVKKLEQEDKKLKWQTIQKYLPRKKKK